MLAGHALIQAGHALISDDVVKNNTVKNNKTTLVSDHLDCDKTWGPGDLVNR